MKAEKAYVQVYTFDSAAGDWRPIGAALMTGGTSGATVALSAAGDRLVIGVPYGGSKKQGSVLIYELLER